MKQADLVAFSRGKTGSSPRVKRPGLRRMSLRDLAREDALPPITVIGAPDMKPTGLERVTAHLASLTFEGSESLVVFSASNGESLARQLDMVSESLKAEQGRGVPDGPPRPSALDAVVQETKVTADLRTSAGRLSAKSIADLYGLPLKELAELLSRTRQGVGKTPDAESLQAPLSFFERIARLRAVLQHDVAFRKWLRIPSRQLGGESPLDWIRHGRWQEVADLVDDILTGATS